MSATYYLASAEEVANTAEKLYGELKERKYDSKAAVEYARSKYAAFYDAYPIVVKTMPDIGFTRNGFIKFLEYYAGHFERADPGEVQCEYPAFIARDMCPQMSAKQMKKMREELANSYKTEAAKFKEKMAEATKLAEIEDKKDKRRISAEVISLLQRYDDRSGPRQAAR